MTSINTIKKRVSWRSFEKKSIPDELRAKLLSYKDILGSAPFSGECRFKLITNKDEEFFKSLGTYGMIRGTADYLAPVITKSDHDLEDFGYLTQMMILKATELGIGSCWLGGSFTKANFQKAVSLSADEIIPAVVALGVPKEKRGVIDSLVRYGAKSKSRKEASQLFFHENFSTPFAMNGELGEALEMVRLAPSASNQQPWRVVCDQKGVHFFIYRAPKYQKSLKRFKLFDLQRTDMGIALAHFDLASKELGLQGNFTKVEYEISDSPLDVEYLVSWIS